jgi:hypothetical protein
VIKEEIGKVTLVVGTVALVGGVIYCICKEIYKDRAGNFREFELESQEMMDELSECSSISTLSAK